MKDIVNLAEDYNKTTHKKKYTQPLSNCDLDWEIKSIFNATWKTDNDIDIPYEVLTHLLDSYYMLPERPDIAFGMCWQAINSSYNEMILNEPTLNGKISDTKGIKLTIDKISSQYSSKYKEYLDIYLQKYPDKLCSFIANYMLKGYVIEKNGFDEKYKQSMYSSFCAKHSQLAQDIKDTYGENYLNICSATIDNNRLRFKIDDINADKSRKIVGNLSKKIHTLVTTGYVEFDKLNNNGKYQHIYNDKQRLELIFHSTLYASRCSNFHGNVASRMNSINANAETYRSYKYIYLVAHMFLAVMMNINGYILDDDLVLLKNNENLL